MDNIVMRPLHDGTAALVLGLGSVRIFALIDLEKKNTDVSNKRGWTRGNGGRIPDPIRREP